MLAMLFSLFVVLVLWATPGQCAKKKPPLQPLNLNTATAAELQQVPGIGPTTAGKTLQAIPGIGPNKLEKMRKYLTVEPLPSNKTQSAHAAAPVKRASAKSGAAQATSPTPKTPPPTASNDEGP